MWDGSANDVRPLSGEWVGETIFFKYYKDPDGYRVLQGRLTRIQKTRPPTIWPEVWPAMTRKAKDAAIAAWNIKSGRTDAARTRRGLQNADGADVSELRLGLAARKDADSTFGQDSTALAPVDDLMELVQMVQTLPRRGFRNR